MISRDLRQIRCSCGSGKFQRPRYDARAIFLTYVCDVCEERKMKEFRADVLTDANYPTVEPVEPERTRPVLKASVCQNCGVNIYLIKTGVDMHKWLPDPDKPTRWRCGNDSDFPVRSHSPMEAS